MADYMSRNHVGRRVLAVLVLIYRKLSQQDLLLALLGDQKPWCWLCSIKGSLSSMGKGILLYLGNRKWFNWWSNRQERVVGLGAWTVITSLTYGTWWSSLTHWRRGKMAAIFQTTFSNAFSWIKMSEFRLIFHWNLFPRVQLTISQRWFR